MSTLERNVRGLLGTKLGMTQTWDENNRIVPVTVIAASTNVVTQVRTPETDGYNAIQVGFGEIDGRKVTKPRAGHFEKAGTTPRRHLVELRTADAADYALGQEVTVEAFEAASMTVIGTMRLLSSQSWVMPSLVPSSPFALRSKVLVMSGLRA